MDSFLLCAWLFLFVAPCITLSVLRKAISMFWPLADGWKICSGSIGGWAVPQSRSVGPMARQKDGFLGTGAHGGQPLAPRHPRGCKGTLAEVSQPSCLAASPPGLPREEAALTSTISAQAQSLRTPQPNPEAGEILWEPFLILIHSRRSAQKKQQCQWWVLHVNFKGQGEYAHSFLGSYTCNHTFVLFYKEPFFWLSPEQDYFLYE